MGRKHGALATLALGALVASCSEPPDPAHDAGGRGADAGELERDGGPHDAGGFDASTSRDAGLPADAAPVACALGDSRTCAGPECCPGEQACRLAPPYIAPACGEELEFCPGLSTPGVPATYCHPTTQCLRVIGGVREPRCIQFCRVGPGCRAGEQCTCGTDRTCETSLELGSPHDPDAAFTLPPGYGVCV
jgi:hypothetical protein